MSEFQLAMSLTFLKRDLAVVIQNTKLKTSENKDITIKEYLLIPTKLPSSQDSVTFTELKNDFNKIFGTGSTEATAEIKTKLQENSSVGDSFNIDNIKFYLKTAYLYKKAYLIKDANEDKECDDEGTIITDDKKAKWEYALSITIDSKDFFSEFKTMSINSISFSIWNTDRDVVKKMMTLGTTDDIFKQLEESSK